MLAGDEQQTIRGAGQLVLARGTAAAAPVSRRCRRVFTRLLEPRVIRSTLHSMSKGSAHYSRRASPRSQPRCASVRKGGMTKGPGLLLGRSAAQSPARIEQAPSSGRRRRRSRGTAARAKTGHGRARPCPTWPPPPNRRDHHRQPDKRGLGRLESRWRAATAGEPCSHPRGRGSARARPGRGLAVAVDDAAAA